MKSDDFFQQWEFWAIFLCMTFCHGTFPMISHVIHGSFNGFVYMIFFWTMENFEPMDFSPWNFRNQILEVWHWRIENHPSSRFQWLRDWSKTWPRQSHGDAWGSCDGKTVVFPRKWTQQSLGDVNKKTQCNSDVCCIYLHLPPKRSNYKYLFGSFWGYYYPLPKEFG